MKNSFKILFLYLTLALLTVSCQKEEDPTPACLQVEVIGADCDSSWYILKIEGADANGQQGNYLGQLQNGYVTTDNLPEAYRQPGTKLEAALELNGEYGPRCVTVTVMYPAVKVTRVCQPARSQG
ncbi:hypothetical protein [Pontibacter fetidus]|uniref:Lipoprotein n=1 Tax=Pontibacter fetidus TaxID=2700082 RepID=A0A6B2H9T5_9BACT|nr:hypothetical protein [Pontibacter fetidus]NDK56104.1 hypothetical protein [Pontibacter fetidus]